MLGAPGFFLFRNGFHTAFHLHIQFSFSHLFLKYESKVPCLVSCLFQHSFADIFFPGFGITMLKTLVFTAFVFDWVLVDGPTSFKSGVDWRTGGPEGLWLLDVML
jgi:hypothetical protein